MNSDPTERPRASWPLLLLVCGFAGLLLYEAQAVFIPIGLAVLFSLLLSSPVESLHRLGMPRPLSALLILGVFIALLCLTINQLWAPAQQWIDGAPHTLAVINRKVAPLTRIVHRIDAISDRAGHVADTRVTPAASHTPAVPMPAVAPAPTTEGSWLLQTRSALISVVTIMILTLFVLGGGPVMLARMGAAFSSHVHAAHVLTVIEAVRREVGRYYATIVLINLGLALVTGVAMMLLHMPNPFLWGAVAGVLNFIPYIGSATTLALLSIVGFVSFDGLGRVAAVAATYLGLATLEGQVIQPLLVGRRLELNPVIVFLALWFGGWLWGIAGVVMAIPSLVALKVVAEHSQRGQPLQEFLSPSSSKRFGARVSKLKTEMSRGGLRGSFLRASARAGSDPLDEASRIKVGRGS
jgi:predicted PurR-regulated permease PerM